MVQTEFASLLHLQTKFMDKKFAIIENGVVINIVVWDGETKFDLKDTQTAVDITDLKEVTIGSTYDGKNFTAPVFSDAALTQEDVIAATVQDQKVAVDDVSTRVSALEQQVSDILTRLSNSGIK